MPLLNFLKNPNKESDFDNDTDTLIKSDLKTLVLRLKSPLSSRQYVGLLDIKPVFETQFFMPFTLCVLIFIHKWQYLLVKVDSGRQVFEKLFQGKIIYSRSFRQKTAERQSPKKYFSYLILDDWTGIQTQTFESNKPKHYILDNGQKSVGR